MMATHIQEPTVIEAAGIKPKEIREYVGPVKTQTSETSVAYMKSPEGWEELGQTPEFEEYTLVLKGTLRVETQSAVPLEIRAGQAVIAHAGEWVRYSTPEPEGAEYVAVCIPPVFAGYRPPRCRLTAIVPLPRSPAAR